MKKEKCSYWRCANSIGLFLLILFTLCFVWFYINPAQQTLHLDLLELTFIGYDGMNAKSFALGAAQSYIWAYVGLAIWQLVGCCFKVGECK